MFFVYFLFVYNYLNYFIIFRLLIHNFFYVFRLFCIKSYPHKLHPAQIAIRTRARQAHHCKKSCGLNLPQLFLCLYCLAYLAFLPVRLIIGQVGAIVNQDVGLPSYILKYSHHSLLRDSDAAAGSRAVGAVKENG